LFLAANSGVLEEDYLLWTHNTSIRLASSLAERTGVLATPLMTMLLTIERVELLLLRHQVQLLQQDFRKKKTNAPTGQIASGQAFFGTSVGAGPANFNNSMRVGFSGIVANSNADLKWHRLKRHVQRCK
jgi:hypothetical protein